jgi:hypothetical protein
MNDPCFQNILDTFTGADGGVRFTKFFTGYNEFKRRAENGDKDAQEIILLVQRFSKLIDVFAR